MAEDTSHLITAQNKWWHLAVLVIQSFNSVYTFNLPHCLSHQNWKLIIIRIFELISKGSTLKQPYVPSPSQPAPHCLGSSSLAQGSVGFPGVMASACTIQVQIQLASPNTPAVQLLIDPSQEFFQTLSKFWEISICLLWAALLLRWSFLRGKRRYWCMSYRCCTFCLRSLGWRRMLSFTPPKPFHTILRDDQSLAISLWLSQYSRLFCVDLGGQRSHLPIKKVKKHFSHNTRSWGLWGTLARSPHTPSCSSVDHLDMAYSAAAIDRKLMLICFSS